MFEKFIVSTEDEIDGLIAGMVKYLKSVTVKYTGNPASNPLSNPPSLPSSLPPSSSPSHHAYLGRPCAITIARSAVDGFITTSAPPSVPFLLPLFSPRHSHPLTSPSFLPLTIPHSLSPTPSAMSPHLPFLPSSVPPSTSSPSPSTSYPRPYPSFPSSPSSPSSSSTLPDDPNNNNNNNNNSTNSTNGTNNTNNTNTHDRILDVEEIQKKVLFALENLIEYWSIQESSTHDTHHNTTNIHDSHSKKADLSRISRMKVHDLTVDPAEVASTMFLHPSLRPKKSN